MGYDPKELRDKSGKWSTGGGGGFKPRLVPDPKGYVNPDELARRTKSHIAAQHGAYNKALSTGKSHMTVIDLTKPTKFDPNAKYPDGSPKYLPADFGLLKKQSVKQTIDKLKKYIASQHKDKY